jgi:hypothetical protein
MSIRQKQIAMPNALHNPPMPAEASLDPLKDLTPDEHAIVRLNIEPGQLKPIQHLNEGHYKQLCRKSMIDTKLMQDIEAHKRYAKEHS